MSATISPSPLRPSPKERGGGGEGENHFFTTGNNIFKEINDASTVANAICSGRDSTKRALVCSITTTRGSLRNFQCRMPLPTSIAYTFSAPRCKRQSVNPPVDEPTSAHVSPVTSKANVSSAASSFSPPRETKRGPESTVRIELA